MIIMRKRDSLLRIIACLYIMFVMFSVTSCASQGVTSADEQRSEDITQTYTADINLEGGTGKAYIKSPVEITRKDGRLTAKLIWSSKNYDYMIVNGVRYENENNGGESTFTVAIDNTEDPLVVTADTVAMSTPHEIEYVIRWQKEEGGQNEDTTDRLTENNTDREAVEKSLEEAGLTLTENYELQYAEGFIMERYGDYDYISICNSGDYLLIPENAEVPGGLPETVVILKKPLDKTYLVSTSAMDLVNACGALDRIRLSGTKESDWYIDEAIAAMKDGRIIYAGKYRAPDYELILENGCDLAIENTMIYHEPAVRSKLEELGIPVLVETSSYESHPLGRLEWIKLYGVLYDKENEAEEFYDRQLEIMEPLLKGNPDTGKKVAFFHVTANGLINVRKPGDYITKMIGIAGGHYVPDITEDEDNAASTMNMQMEDFYEKTSDADIIIYNSTIGGEIRSVDELIAKNILFKDFKAVKESNVYCTQRDLFQKITKMADFMKDLNDVANDVDRQYTYLNRLD